MDADVMITIAFCLEVVLFALATGVFMAYEAHKSRSEAAVEKGREHPKPTEIRTRPRPSVSANLSAASGAAAVTARGGDAVRGPRS